MLVTFLCLLFKFNYFVLGTYVFWVGVFSTGACYFVSAVSSVIRMGALTIWLLGLRLSPSCQHFIDLMFY